MSEIRRRDRLRRNLKKFRYSPTQSPRYYRDLPDDRPAPAVDRLVHFYEGKPDISRQISATLLELNLKKLIHFQTAAGDAEILLNEQLGEKLFPPPVPQDTVAPDPDQTHILGYQETLWDFLLNEAGENGRIAMKDLKQYIKDDQEVALSFRRSFESAVAREHTERIEMQDIAEDSSEWGNRLRLPALLTTLYRMGKNLGEYTVDILDQQAEDDLALWQAFGRFLDDFTTFDDKKLPEFPVWREYYDRTGSAGHRWIRKCFTASLTDMSDLIDLLRENTALFAGRAQERKKRR